MPRINNVADLPLEIITHLAINFLGPMSAIRFLEVILRSYTITSLEVNHTLRSNEKVALIYHQAKKRCLEFASFNVLVNPDLFVGARSSFYRASEKWYGWGSLPGQATATTAPQALNICANQTYFFGLWATTPQRVTPVKIVATYVQTLLLTEEGNVYLAKENQKNLSAEANLAVEKLSLLNVIDICAGSLHFLLLTKEGKVYSFGKNNYGQLGLGHVDKACSPQLIGSLADKKIVSIFAGGEHSFCISEANEIYGFGWNEFGQLGVQTGRSQNIPLLIESLKDEIISTIALGFNHSLFLSKTGKVYGCGENLKGKLGLGHDNDCYDKPLLLTHLQEQKIVMVVTGDAHTLCLTAEGNVYGFGSNAKGQLGLGVTLRHTNIPQLLTSLPDKISKITAGAYFTLCLTSKQKLIGFGENKKGVLGLGPNKNEFSPQQINLPDEKTSGLQPAL